jgi:hypothetical protein
MGTKRAYGLDAAFSAYHPVTRARPARRPTIAATKAPMPKVIIELTGGDVGASEAMQPYVASTLAWPAVADGSSPLRNSVMSGTPSPSLSTVSLSILESAVLTLPGSEPRRPRARALTTNAEIAVVPEGAPWWQSEQVGSTGRVSDSRTAAGNEGEEAATFVDESTINRVVTAVVFCK